MVGVLNVYFYLSTYIILPETSSKIFSYSHSRPVGWGGSMGLYDPPTARRSLLTGF